MAEGQTSKAPSNPKPVDETADPASRNQSEALNQVANLVTNYSASNPTNRPTTVEAFKNNLFKLDRGIVKEMFDAASAVKNKPELTFTIQELPGIYIPKKLFTEDLKVPAKKFMSDYDQLHFHEQEVKSRAEASAKSEGSSTKLDAAKAAVLGTGFGNIGKALGGMVGIKPTRKKAKPPKKKEVTQVPGQRPEKSATRAVTMGSETDEPTLKEEVATIKSSNQSELKAAQEKQLTEIEKGWDEIAQAQPTQEPPKTLRGLGVTAPVKPAPPVAVPSKVATLRGPVSSNVGQAPVVSEKRTLRGGPAASGKPTPTITSKTIRGAAPAPLSPVASTPVTRVGTSPAVSGSTEIKVEGNLRNEMETQVPNIPPPPPSAQGTNRPIELRAEGEINQETTINVPRPPVTGSASSVLSYGTQYSPPPQASPSPIRVSGVFKMPEAPDRRARVGAYGQKPTRIIKSTRAGQPTRFVIPTRPGTRQAEVTEPPSPQVGTMQDEGSPIQSATNIEEAPNLQPTLGAGLSSAPTSSPSIPLQGRMPKQTARGGASGSRAGEMARKPKKSGSSIGPQEIKPPLTKAMDLHAAQREDWRGREQAYEGLSADEGLELSDSGLESEMGGPEIGPTPPIQFGQLYDPLDKRRPAIFAPEYLGPGSMATEPEEDLEKGGGEMESDEIEKLSQFESDQRQSALTEEQFIGGQAAPGRQTRTATAGKEPTSQISKKSARQTRQVQAPGKLDEIGMSLKLLSNQANLRLGQEKQRQVQEFKDKLEKLKKAKQTFKNLFDAGEIGASESILPIFTLWAEWNIDLINKHVANGKIPLFEQKPGPGALPLEKTLSQVKDGITILADILIPVSLIASLVVPLTIVALIVGSMFGTFLQIAKLFGMSIF
jgi:hypothetical protein